MHNIDQQDESVINLTSLSKNGDFTPLEFVGDAITLSGLTGTKLKCDVIGEYYPFWLNIMSGEPSANVAERK